MILVKKMKFSHLSCLLKIDREKVFPDVLDKKEAFYKEGKIDIFAKGIVHDFGQKVEVFLIFCVYKK